MTSDNAYQHGGSPEKDMARLGLPRGPILDFSVNLNPMGPPPLIRERWSDLWDQVEGYPSLQGEGVAGYYGERFGIPVDRFLAGNGSTEMIYLIPRVLRLERVGVITPSYHDYERACRLAGAEVVHFPLDEPEGFSPPRPGHLERFMEKVEGIWLGRPNNPSATMIPKAHILDLAGRFPEKWFIVDEAFIQFLEDWREESFLFEPSATNILVVHSLTKFYALAGLRLGGVFGDKGVIDRLRFAKEPWTVNGVADRVAPLLAQCWEYDDQARAAVSEEIRYVQDRILPLDGIMAFPSRVNYLLCRWTRTPDLDDLLHHLLSNGFYVRDCRNFPGLEAGYFRVGLRVRHENELLVECLASACERVGDARCRIQDSRF
ncbi:MAG: pyridoxal phosphate-dependent class II aminotransferase [Deltaproteobacteria bacterium]|nr:pyridoxal phosphate-dependent class II aminotransferase [Deltaproteobacteria bacterium]